MARSFNGSSDVANIAVDLSGQSKVMIAAWMYRDTTVGAHGIWDYGTTKGFDLIHSGGSDFIRSYGTSFTWTDSYIVPSLNTWHHYLWIISGSSGNQFNRVFIDGVEVGLAAGSKNGETYTWNSATLRIGSRGAGTFFSCRIEEFAVWNGVASQAPIGPPGNTAIGCTSGWNPPRVFGAPTVYIPMLGDTPEPDYSGGRTFAALTGTTYVKGPTAKTLLMC